MQRGRGFTLIELVIVVGVIGVLAGTAMVAYTAQKRASEYRTMRATVYALCHAVKDRFYTNQGIVATSSTAQTNTQYQANIVESTFGDYRIQSVTATGFAVRVRYWARGAGTGSSTATYTFNAAGQQTSCSGTDCMSG
ncbi:MAG: prepilin-type N-terminal cleavage/methylation domain-containing protein [Deltaproteobacteria bacterium]